MVGLQEPLISSHTPENRTEEITISQVFGNVLGSLHRLIHLIHPIAWKRKWFHSSFPARKIDNLRVQ